MGPLVPSPTGAFHPPTYSPRPGVPSLGSGQGTLGVASVLSWTSLEGDRSNGANPSPIPQTRDPVTRTEQESSGQTSHLLPRLGTLGLGHVSSPPFPVYSRSGALRQHLLPSPAPSSDWGHPREHFITIPAAGKYTDRPSFLQENLDECLYACGFYQDSGDA